MNDMAHDSWFYTREGEKIGPVTLSDLRIKATEGGLNPRLDMAWTQGMTDWKPTGEIDGLFERKNAPEPPESLSPAVGPYAPLAQESVADAMVKQGNWPGARRRSYLIATILFPFLWTFGVAAGEGFLTARFGGEIMKFVAPALGLLPLVVFIYFSIRRFINLGMSGWWMFGTFIPILNVWLGYRCFACPSGYAFHKKLDGIGVFLAILYWLMFVLVILIIAAAIALLLGALGTPEIQQQIREIIEKATSASTR